MADQSYSSWWNGLLETAKETSQVALQATRRDLSEFITVLKNDTEKAVSGTLKTLLSDNPVIGDNEGEHLKDTETQEDVTYSASFPRSASTATTRAELSMYKMECNNKTYTREPIGDEFLKWSATFKIDDKTEEISEILLSKNHIQQLYSQLVPTIVSYSDFWKRYFYQSFQLKQDEERRASLFARANQSEETGLTWDEEEEDEQQPSCQREESKNTPKPQEVVPQEMVRNNNHCHKDENYQKEEDDSQSVNNHNRDKIQLAPSLELVTNPSDQNQVNCKEVAFLRENAGTASSCSHGDVEVTIGPAQSDSGKSDSDSFVCIPDNQSPTPLKPTGSWLTISTQVSEGWDAEPEKVLQGSNFNSGSDLVSIQESENSESGHHGSPSGCRAKELEQLVKEIDKECNLGEVGDGSESGDGGWETWDD